MSFATHGMLESHQALSHTTTPFFSNVGQVDFRPGIRLQHDKVDNMEYKIPLGPNGDSGTLKMQARQIEEPGVQKHERIAKSTSSRKNLTFDAYIDELAKCHVATFQQPDDVEKSRMKMLVKEFVSAGRPDFGDWRNLNYDRHKQNDCTQLLSEYNRIKKADKKIQDQRPLVQSNHDKSTAVSKINSVVNKQNAMNIKPVSIVEVKQQKISQSQSSKPEVIMPPVSVHQTNAKVRECYEIREKKFTL